MYRIGELFGARHADVVLVEDFLSFVHKSPECRFRVGAHKVLALLRNQDVVFGFIKRFLTEK